MLTEISAVFNVGLLCCKKDNDFHEKGVIEVLRNVLRNIIGGFQRGCESSVKKCENNEN